MEKETQLYEIGYLLNSALKDEEVLSFSENLRNFIAGKNGLIISTGTPKRQSLSYRIKKEDAAVFNWIKFTLKPELLKDFKEYFDKLPVVLRFLIIKTKQETARKTSPRIKPVDVPKTDSTQIPETKDKSTPVVESKPVENTVKEEDIDKKIEELLGEN
ncbi:MAG: 30S ribosomal protein S6 [bacterium]|nr:30S ribosomal protein S6 [bacterium]